MPITAKLSREFYQRFGDKVVNEMVDLFNRIDEASRSDLRLLNEQNALRFEARLDQRTAELRTEFDKRFGELRTEIEKLSGRVDTRFAEQGKALEAALHAHTRWMIGMWAAVIASQIGLWLR